MVSRIFVFLFGVILNEAASQSIDYISSPSLIMDPSTMSLIPCNSEWEELLPALKLLKSTSCVKKERLLNVVKLIKFLLSDEVERKQCDKILEEIKETDEYECPDVPDIDGIVEERLKPITKAIEDGKYMEREKCIPKNVHINNDIAQNKTADCSKILAKISAALAKVKENNENQESQNRNAPSTNMPIFRPKKIDCADFNQPLFGNVGTVSKKQTGSSMFNIPCQRATDILEETSTYVIPKEAYCDMPANINVKSILKNSNLDSDNIPFQIVPESVSCVDSDDAVAVLFKPKKISMMQVYGNLLKKITITVLVPYYVSKLGVK